MLVSTHGTWKILPFRGCAGFSSAAENHNKPDLSSPPSSGSVESFPIRVPSAASVSHMFTCMVTITPRRVNNILERPRDAVNHGVNPRRSVVTLPRCFLMAATRRQMSSRAKINASLCVRHQSSGPERNAIGQEQRSVLRSRESEICEPLYENFM